MHIESQTRRRDRLGRIESGSATVATVTETVARIAPGTGQIIAAGELGTGRNAPSSEHEKLGLLHQVGNVITVLPTTQLIGGTIKEVVTETKAATTVEKAAVTETKVASNIAETGTSALEGENVAVKGVVTENKPVDIVSNDSSLLSKSIGERGVELADPKLINKLKSKGYEFFDDAEAQRLLDFQNANASTFLTKDIIIRTDPRKIEVLEEYLHNVMNKKGLYEGLNDAEKEILTKKWMTDHAKPLKINEEDVKWLQKSIETYKN